MTSLPRRLLINLVTKLPNCADRYPSWHIWIIAAGFQAWTCIGFRQAREWYWNRAMWNYKENTR